MHAVLHVEEESEPEQEPASQEITVRDLHLVQNHVTLVHVKVGLCNEGSLTLLICGHIGLQLRLKYST